MDKIMRPKKAVKNKVKHFIKTSFYGGPWLSIHSRGVYDINSEHTMKAISCANHLLKLDKIKYVFFSSESQRLAELVESNVVPSSAVVTIEKKFENESLVSSASLPRPRYIEHGPTALEDWFLMGEADYCMTPTPKSVFSSTSVMRTACRYIPFSAGSNCSVDNSTFYIKPKNMLVFDQPKSGSLSNINVDKFWARIPRKMVAVKFSAVEATTIEGVRSFWLTPRSPPKES